MTNIEAKRMIKRIEKRFRALTDCKYSLFDGHYDQAMDFLKYLNLQHKRIEK